MEWYERILWKTIWFRETRKTIRSIEKAIAWRRHRLWSVQPPSNWTRWNVMRSLFIVPIFIGAKDMNREHTKRHCVLHQPKETLFSRLSSISTLFRNSCPKQVTKLFGKVIAAECWVEDLILGWDSSSTWYMTCGKPLNWYQILFAEDSRYRFLCTRNHVIITKKSWFLESSWDVGHQMGL